MKCVSCVLFLNLCITLRQYWANLYPGLLSSAVWIGFWNILYSPIYNTKQAVSILCLLVAKCCSICGCVWCVAIHVFPLYTLSVPKIWLPFPSILEKRENIDGLNIRVTDAATQLGQRFRRQKSPAWKNRPGNDAVKETMIATVKQTILVGWLLFILDDSHACLVCLCYLRRNRKLVKLL